MLSINVSIKYKRKYRKIESSIVFSFQILSCVTTEEKKVKKKKEKIERMGNVHGIPDVRLANTLPIHIVQMIGDYVFNDTDREYFRVFSDACYDQAVTYARENMDIIHIGLSADGNRRMCKLFYDIVPYARVCKTLVLDGKRGVLSDDGRFVLANMPKIGMVRELRVTGVYEAVPIRVRSKNLEKIVLWLSFPPPELRLDTPNLKSLVYCLTPENAVLTRMLSVGHFPSLEELFVCHVLIDDDFIFSLLRLNMHNVGFRDCRFKVPNNLWDIFWRMQAGMVYSVYS